MYLTLVVELDEDSARVGGEAAALTDAAPAPAASSLQRGRL